MSRVVTARVLRAGVEPERSLTDEQRAELCDWLETLGLDRTYVCAVGINARGMDLLGVEEYVRDEQGRIVHDGGVPEIRSHLVAVPQRHPKPDWWQPTKGSA